MLPVHDSVMRWHLMSNQKSWEVLLFLFDMQ